MQMMYVCVKCLLQLRHGDVIIGISVAEPYRLRKDISEITLQSLKANGLFKRKVARHSHL